MLKLNKSLIISIICNILLLVLLLTALYQKETINDMLTQEYLASHSHIPKRKSTHWDSDSKLGYYLFTDEEQKSLKITTFNQDVILESDYSFIGNGVFKLSDEQGYVVRTTTGLKIFLSEDNPLIFKEYLTYDQNN